MNKMKIPEPFWKDSHWIEKHYSKLMETYPDQWIAVVNQQVTAHGKNMAKVKREAAGKTKSQAFPVVFIECGNHVYRY